MDGLVLGMVVFLVREAKQQLVQFEDVLTMHKEATSAFPSTEQRLQALMVNPEDVANWDGPYLQTGIPQIISYGADGKPGGTEIYELSAYTVMPNHVHLLVKPLVTLPKLTKSLKGITAKRANQMLASTGSTFWQEESYDHLVRNDTEFYRIRNYIEENPVRAGLVNSPADFRWSSGSIRGSTAGQGVRPTADDVS